MKCTVPKVWPQYLVTFICNIGTLTFGIHTGWLAPLHHRLTSPTDSPLGRDSAPLTTEDISWIGSIPSLTFLLGTPVYGYLLQALGRRVSLLLAILPTVASFALLAAAHNTYVIFVARALAGFASAGSVLAAPVYVAESTGPDTRGFLSGFAAFFVTAGIVFAALAGGYLPYRLFNAVCLAVSLVFLLAYRWLPETPVYLLTRGLARDALSAVHKLRIGPKPELEIARLEKEFRERTANPVRGNRAAFAYALFLSLGVMTFHQLSGCSPMIAYTSRVFRDAGTRFDPVAASLGTSLTLLAGSVLAPFLMDRLGRRTILMVSLSVMGVCLGVVSWLPGLDWVSALALFAYGGGFASGIGAVSFVLIAELFPPEARGVSGAVTGTWSSILAFLANKFFPAAVDAVGLSPVLSVFAGSCMVGVGFVAFFVVETRGRSTNEVWYLIRERACGGSGDDEVGMSDCPQV